MRATVRWARADLRANRGEALFIILATAGIIASLLLAGALLLYAANPWQRVFTESSGAHVWIHTRADAPTEKLTDIDGVAAFSGPFPTAPATAEIRGAKVSLELRGAPTEPPKRLAHWSTPDTGWRTTSPTASCSSDRPPMRSGSSPATLCASAAATAEIRLFRSWESRTPRSRASYVV